MKIAFFTETFLPKVDGIVTRLTKTVRHLVEAGDEVVVFCQKGRRATTWAPRWWASQRCPYRCTPS